MRKGERAEMSQESNYISIAEFSKRANISKQRVYQLLNKSLKDFVKEIDGVKMLHIQALERYQNKENNSRVEQGFEQDLNNPLNDTLIKTIEILQEQLNVKDRQIEELNNRLAETTHALHQSQELTHREQDLNAKNVLMLESQEQKKKKKGIFNLFNKKSKREEQKNE
jgi:hypothetical protein